MSDLPVYILAKFGVLKHRFSIFLVMCFSQLQTEFVSPNVKNDEDIKYLQLFLPQKRDK